MFNATPIRLLIVFASLFALHSAAWAETPGGALPDNTLVVLDLEMTGDLGDSRRNPEWLERRISTSEALRVALDNLRIYAVIDRAATLRAIDASGAAPPFHACNGCELDIARRLHARYVLFGWVSRVSNLVLSLNLEIKDAADGRTVLRKGFDFRGDNDKGWRKAIDYFVKNLKSSAFQV